MELMSVSDAADQLGVSTRQVQHLVDSGDLRRRVPGYVDQTSVELLTAVRRGSHTRAWSEPTAWGAVALLSGITPGWMGESQRSRLKARLRTMAPSDLVERTRNRARVSRYSGHPATHARLREELVDTSMSATALGLAETNAVDGYLASVALDDVVTRHGLISDDRGRLTLRATTTDLTIVSDLASRSTVLAVLDLAGSLDRRESQTGLDALNESLHQFNA